MAEDDAKKAQPNGILVVKDASDSEDGKKEELTVCTILNRLIAAIFFSDPDSKVPLLQRIKSSLSVNVPLLRKASRNTGRHVLIWTRGGGPFRPIFVVSVGTIALLALTGLLVFMLFFAAATINAVIISLLVSLAAAGGFLAIFFSCVAAIYVGALTIAVFAISTATISAITAVLIAAGGFSLLASMPAATPEPPPAPDLIDKESKDEWFRLKPIQLAVRSQKTYVNNTPDPVISLMDARHVLMITASPNDMGWIGFFCTLWLGARKIIGLAKHSVSMTGSAVSAYSTAWQARNLDASKKSN
ncbi:hypothetical protein CASFOL_042792 [Castilleja foliolosa]|uniref:Transmembrane protein n=1 Tax=Castilleja foliolosa TaxID=1961234 RepID=A0ABD3B7W8_9LAMI